MDTFNGQAVFTIAATQKLLDCGRSTVYRLIERNVLEVIKRKGLGPRITARSILKLLELAGQSDPAIRAAPAAANGTDTVGCASAGQAAARRSIDVRRHPSGPGRIKPRP